MTDKQKVSNESPIFWYRPRSDGGYEGPLHSDQIEDVRKASGAWVPLFAGSAPVSAEPVTIPEGWKLVPVQPTEEMIVNVDEEVGGSCHSCSAWRASEDDCKRVWAAMIEASPIAPVAAQPDVTQQTLDDVMAGIPARDAEIEALRKEIETLRAKQPVSCADGLADGEIDIADVRQYQQSWGCLAHPGVRALVDGYQSSTQPSGNSGELPDAARVPLDSLHADAVYLLSRVKQETLSIHDAALSIQHHIDSARAALAQQDAETGKSVSVENQGVTKQDADKVQSDLLSSLVEIVDAVIANDEEGLIEHSETIVKARAAIDAARKEQA